MKVSKAEGTRSDILKKAFELIYKNGYRMTSIDDILTTLNMTKGAFYYHFKNKEDMGIALITDVMHKELWPTVQHTIGASKDFRKNLYNMLKKLLIAHPIMTCEYGCPAVNLIHEMAPLNERFKTELRKNMGIWEKAIEEEILRAQNEGQLSKDHDAKALSLYVITQYHGVRNMGKVLGNSYYNIFLKEFKNYLNTLK